MGISTPDEATQTPAIALTMQCQVGQEKVISMMTSIERDCPLEALDALLDKLAKAGDRQSAVQRLKELERKEAAESKLYKARKEDMIRIDAAAEAEYSRSGRKAPFSPDKLPANRQQERNNAEVFIKRTEESIIETRAEIALLKAQVNGVAHSPANSS